MTDAPDHAAAAAYAIDQIDVCERVPDYNLALAYLDATQWQPIETAPMDGLHLRGLWVTNGLTGKRRWEIYFGNIDDHGEFVDQDGNDCGWPTDAYEMWMPLPMPPQVKP